MSCHETQDLIHGYLDGELDLVRNLAIEQHLQSCQACAQAYRNQQALRSAIRTGSLYFKAPANLQKRVRSATRKASKAETRPQVWSWRWLSVGTSLAVLAIITWSLVPFLTGPSADDRLAQEVISAHVRSLMVNHLVDVSSSDQHTVKPWFNGKLDFSPPVKDLTDYGFPLVGGRLDYLNNRPVAALVYRRQQHFINLFIQPSSQGSEVDQKTVARQGYHLFHWTKAGMIYWVVSDLNESELQQFAKLVQNQASPATAR